MFRKKNENAEQESRLYRRPLVDIAETEKELLIAANLPGADRKDVEISMEQGLLTLKAVPGAGGEKESRRMRREFRLPGYYRQFRLPDEADPERISANLKNGVLAITVPRKAEKEPRRIEVKDE